MEGPVIQLAAGKHAEIERFFACYRDAFNAADAAAIARLVAVPCLLVEKETTLWRTDEDVLQAIIGLLAFYTRSSFQAAHFTVKRVMALDDSNVVVDVAWTIERSGRLPAWQFCTGYNLRQAGGNWRVVCCTAYEEAGVRQRTG